MKFDILLIDGKNALHRAHHTSKELTTRIDGEVVSIGATYQFLRIILSVIERHAANKFTLIIAWEGGPELERHKRFDGYKRRERNLDIERQFELLHTRILPTLGWCQALSPGWEADDVLGTLSRVFELKEKRVGILSGDMDMHQVVSDYCHIISPNVRADLDDGITWRPRDVRRRWGSEGFLVPDIKALCGDHGDGIPGAPGIGEDWAKALIAQYGSLDGVIREAKLGPDTFGYEGSKRAPAKARSIIVNEDKLYLFRELCTLNRRVELEFSKRNYSESGVRRLLAELRFASLLSQDTLDLIGIAAGVQQENA